MGVSSKPKRIQPTTRISRWPKEHRGPTSTTIPINLVFWILTSPWGSKKEERDLWVAVRGQRDQGLSSRPSIAQPSRLGWFGQVSFASWDGLHMSPSSRPSCFLQKENPWCTTCGWSIYVLLVYIQWYIHLHYISLHCITLHYITLHTCIYMYVYIYVYTHTCTYMYYKYVYIYICIHVYIYIDICG